MIPQSPEDVAVRFNHPNYPGAGGYRPKLPSHLASQLYPDMGRGQANGGEASTPNLPAAAPDNQSFYTPGGRAQYDNWQKAQTRTNVAASAPAPGANLSPVTKLARQIFPGMKTTAPGSMSVTLDNGQQPAATRPGDQVGTNGAGQTTVTRQGTQRVNDGVDAAGVARDNYIKEHQNLADATKPSYLTDRQNAADETRRSGQMQDEEISRYHQMTPALINEMSNKSDWTPQDRQQLLDAMKFLHQTNIDLIRNADEARKQGQGDKRLDQNQSRIDQGQKRIDQTGEYRERTAGQRDKSLKQRDRGLDQSERRLKSGGKSTAPPTTQPGGTAQSDFQRIESQRKPQGEPTNRPSPANWVPGGSGEIDMGGTPMPTGGAASFTDESGKVSSRNYATPSPTPQRGIPQSSMQPTVGQAQKQEIKAGTIIELQNGQRQRYNGLGWENI